MTLAEKFTFDLDFDEERARLAKELQVKHAEKQRLEQERMAEEAKTRFSPDQLEDVKEQARAEGKKQALMEIEQSNGNMIARILTLFEEMSAQEKNREKLAQRTAIETAFALLKKISPSLVKGKELDDVNELIAQSFQQNPDEQRLVIRVHDDLLDDVIKGIDKAAADNGFSGKPIVMGDQTLAPHDCRVEWADGGVERVAGGLWDGLEKAINHILVGLPKAPKKVEKEIEADVKEEQEEKNQSETSQMDEELPSTPSDDNELTQKEEVNYE